MEYKATLRYLHLTPRKVRRVADLIRGSTAAHAEALLDILPQRAARPLKKLLRSAVANARQNQPGGAALRIKTLRVDEGPRRRRYMPRAFGRTSPIVKRLSHVTAVLESSDKEAPRLIPKATPPSTVFEPPRETAQRPKFHPPTEEPPPAFKQRSRLREFGRRVFRRKAI